MTQAIVVAALYKFVSLPDFEALRDGYVSVTPLHLDLTCYPAAERLRTWDWNGN